MFFSVKIVSNTIYLLSKRRVILYLNTDATSRHPCPSSTVGMFSVEDVAEHHIVAAIRCDTTKLTSISWKTLEDET